MTEGSLFGRMGCLLAVGLLALLLPLVLYALNDDYTWLW
jgi:hypothetical protein